MRTHGQLLADSPQTGGVAFADFNEFVIDNNTFTTTRAGLGIWKARRVSGGAEAYNFRLNISAFFLQKILATAQVPFLNQNLPNAAAILGQDNPYYPGSSEITGTPILNALTLPKKGMRIKNINVVYGVSTLALTSATPSLNTTLFANNAAPTVVNMPVTGALTLATQAQPYAIQVTVSNPAFITADLTELTLELAFVLQNTTVLDFYGVFIHFDYNAN